MAKVKGKNTNLEKTVRLNLKSAGIKFEANPKMFGHPDIALPKAKIAIFLDGCFWHGCRCKTTPTSNITYWKSKIAKNKSRDRKVSRELAHQGWKVIRTWEHQVKSNPNAVLIKLKKAFNY